MNATRATTMTADGAVFGTTAENPPDDPPPWDNRRNNNLDDSFGWLLFRFVLVLLHLIAMITHAVNH